MRGSAMVLPSPGSAETHAPPRREVLRLAWPIGVSMTSLTLKGFVDMAMIGRLGVDELGGAGLAAVCTWSALTFPWGVLRGQRPLVAQYVGAKRRAMAFSFGIHAFHLAVLAGLALLLAAPALGRLMTAFAGATDLPTHGVVVAGDYFRTRMQWALPLLVTTAVAEYLRSLGRTRLPMAVDLLVHPVNVFFNWVLVFGHFGVPALGARGAALGTGIADTIGLLLILSLARQDGGPNLVRVLAAARLRLSRLARVVSVGLTGGVQFALESVAFVFITWLVGHTGEVALAVHQAGIQIVHLSLLPAVAVADAGSILIGRAVGRGDLAAARRSLRAVLEIVTPFMAAMGVLFLLRGRALAGIFLHAPDPAVHEAALALAAGVMAAAALWQIGDAFQVTFRFALRATGDHQWVMWTGILCAWLLSLPLASWVVFGLDGDVTDVWLVWAAEIFAGSAVFVWRWRSGAWQRKGLVRRAA